MAIARLTPSVPFLASLAIASTIGAVAWTGAYWRIGLAVLVPVLIFTQQSRSNAAVVAFAYFGVASWPLLAAAASFGIAAPPLVWFVASVILVAPWLALWSSNRKQCMWRCPLALSLSAVPPIGLINWASPLVSSGVMLPGTAWFGLTAIALLPGLLLQRTARFPTAVMALLACAASNIGFVQPKKPDSFATLSTNFGNPTTAERRLQVEEKLQAAALRADAAVVIFPEAIVKRWSNATEAFWEPTIQRLQVAGRTALIGAGVSIHGSDAYRNELIAVGADAPPAFIQRIPVPLGMWNPFATAGSVPLHLSGSGTLTIRGKTAAVLICYEQLLVWPMIRSALERPNLLIGIANQFWTIHTSIPTAQQACLTAWSRLFDLPVLTATNH